MGSLYHRPMPDESPTAPSLPMLRGERVWLRASTKSDFTTDVDAINDAETGHFLGVKMPISPEGAEQFAQQVVTGQGTSIWSFTICLLADNRPIGNVTLRNPDRENGSAEVAIVVTDKASQGHGLGTDALNCLVDFGFGELRLERIYLHVFDYNARAIRSYEKAGFQTDRAGSSNRPQTAFNFLVTIHADPELFQRGHATSLSETGTII